MVMDLRFRRYVVGFDADGETVELFCGVWLRETKADPTHVDCKLDGDSRRLIIDSQVPDLGAVGFYLWTCSDFIRAGPGRMIPRNMVNRK